MEFRVQVQVRLSFKKSSKMAIAYYVDPEYGPLPPPVPPLVPLPPTTPRLQPPPQPIVEIDENNNHVIPDLVHGVAHFPQLAQNQGQISQVRVLPSRPVSRWSVTRLLSPFFCRTSTSLEQRGRSSNVREHELPDVVQCHHGFTLDLSFESSRVFRSGPQETSDPVSSDETPRRRCRHPAGGNQRILNNQPLALPEDENLDEWTVELKVAVSMLKEVGTDLRRAADQFNFELESSIRRQRSARRESVQVRCNFRLATIPTLAVVGIVTGFVYLRRLL